MLLSNEHLCMSCEKFHEHTASYSDCVADPSTKMLKQIQMCFQKMLFKSFTNDSPSTLGQFREVGGEPPFIPWNHAGQWYAFLSPVLTLEIGARQDSVVWLWQVYYRASVTFPFQRPLLTLPWSELPAGSQEGSPYLCLQYLFGLPNILPHSCLYIVGPRGSNFRSQSCYFLLLC